MDASSLVALPLLLALEMPGGHAGLRHSFERDEADALAALIAADLLALVPAVAQARLGVVGALFDAVELQRPGFAVWATLDELVRRVPRSELQQVIAFGSHEGRMPAELLQPEVLHAGGSMRVLPLTLLVPEDAAEALSGALEVELIGRGEAGTRTADWLMRTLGVTLEHARYLSRNDLLALTCVQYEHMNLAPLWVLLEAALLTPYREESVLSARGLALRYAGGAVFAQSPAQWLAAQTGEAAQRSHGFAGVLFELRQYATLLRAHHVPLRLDDDSAQTADGYLLETLATPLEPAGAPLLFAHEAPGLGVVAVTAAQRTHDRVQLLAHGYPMQAQALGPLVATLAARYGIATELHALGGVGLDEAGLSVPAAPTH